MVEQSRVYRTVLSESHQLFSLLDTFCHESKNLYNYANYILRSRYREKDFALFNFYRLRKFIQSDTSEDNPWRQQATTHIGAETLRTLVNSWQAYFAAVQYYSRFPEKFRTCPKQPGYLPKNGMFQMVPDTDNFKFDGAVVRFLRFASRYVADLAKANYVADIVCGYNTEWKQEVQQELRRGAAPPLRGQARWGKGQRRGGAGYRHRAAAV